MMSHEKKGKVQSFPFDACDCTHTHTHTSACTTSLMSVKNSMPTSVYNTYCLGHCNETYQIELLSFFFNLC